MYDPPLSDNEYPDEPDDDWLDDDAEVVPCPSCGADVYEDAIRCPVCGDYVTHSSSPWAGRPLWWIAIGLLGVVAVIITLTAL